MSTLTAPPERFAAGTTVKFTSAFADYPAPDWLLTFSLAGAGVLSAEASPSGTKHAVTLSVAQTAELPAGRYRWALKATKDGESYIADSGNLDVDPNLDAAGAGDLQSEPEKQLALVNARIAELHARGIVEYSVDGIMVRKTDPKDLYLERARLQLAVTRERRGGGIGLQHRIAFTSGDS